MQKDQVYVGMVLNYKGCKVLVEEKLDKSVYVVYIEEELHGKVEAAYEDLRTVPGDQGIRSYNARIREANARYNGKFVKNEDKSFVFEEGEKVWFTSDTHFCHDNIIRFCDRPFISTEDMNKQLVEHWNELIGPDDTVFHLGDFCWGGSASWEHILGQLNGHIHLIIGNHDVKNLRQGYMKHFESVSFQKQIEVEGQKIYLNHYPFLTYGGIYRKEPIWQLFGHVHSKNGQGGADSGRLRHLLPTQYDVGVDNNYYAPLNFTSVKRLIEQQIKEAEEAKLSSIQGPEQVDRMIEDYEQVALKVSILERLLTPEQRVQYNEMVTDNGKD